MPSARRGRDYWCPLVSEYESSELSHAEFCAERGLSLGAFRQWLYRLRREGEGTTPRFVEVHASGVGLCGETACVVELGDASLSFRTLPAPDYLAALLRSARRDAP